MARVLAELGDAENYPGGLAQLFLDGKLSELFAVILGAAITDDCAVFRAPTLSRTERAAIREAKRIIDAAIAYAPSCEELARQVHISAAKLSRGFSAIYGQSLHQYVIAERLETGARRLWQSEQLRSGVQKTVRCGAAGVSRESSERTRFLIVFGSKSTGFGSSRKEAYANISGEIRITLSHRFYIY